jgi:hypothetical protein
VRRPFIFRHLVYLSYFSIAILAIIFLLNRFFYFIVLEWIWVNPSEPDMNYIISSCLLRSSSLQLSVKHLFVLILIDVLPLVALAQLLLFLDTDVIRIYPRRLQHLFLLQVEMHLLYVPLIQ